MRHVCSVLLGSLIVCWWPSVALATPPTQPPGEPSTTLAGDTFGPPVPSIEVPPPIVGPFTASSPLVVVPAGCTAPPAPVAVFLGTLIDADSTTARFDVRQIRAGTLDGYAVGTVVDVRYDDDIRFLRKGQQYLVGAAAEPLVTVLHSKVRVPAPLFGGDAVIGVNDTDVHCPRLEDGVTTLRPDGTGVDTGVLAPLKTAKKSVLKAIMKPLGIAAGILVLLVAIKLLIFAMVRAVREAGVEEIPIRPEDVRDRRHADDDENLAGAAGRSEGP